MRTAELLRGGDLAARWLGDATGAQARGAHVYPLGAPVNECTDSLNVRVPTTLGATMGVRDVHAETRLFAAKLTDRRHLPQNLLDGRDPRSRRDRESDHRSPVRTG
jgi:hypothetical protein